MTVSRTQCISLLKNFKKGKGRNLPDPSGPLAQLAPSSLPTRKLDALPVTWEMGNPYHAFPKCLCTLGSLISWLQLQKK